MTTFSSFNFNQSPPVHVFEEMQFRLGRIVDGNVSWLSPCHDTGAGGRSQVRGARGEGDEPPVPSCTSGETENITVLARLPGCCRRHIVTLFWFVSAGSEQKREKRRVVEGRGANKSICQKAVPNFCHKQARGSLSPADCIQEPRGLAHRSSCIGFKPSRLLFSELCGPLRLRWLSRSLKAVLEATAVARDLWWVIAPNDLAASKRSSSAKLPSSGNFLLGAESFPKCRKVVVYSRLSY